MTETAPSIEICCPIPKGDRLDRMIDQLTQLGVDSWTPLITDRSERKAETIRQDRIERNFYSARPDLTLFDLWKLNKLLELMY